MRRFFSFRSSASSSANNDSVSPATNNKDVKIPAGEKVRHGSQTPEESVLKPHNRYPDTQDLSHPHLRRSLSFSSPASYSLIEENSNFLGDLHKSPSSYVDAQHLGECPIHCLSSTPERYIRKNKGAHSGVQKTHEVSEFDSLSSKGYQCSSGDSSYSSPVPLRCRAARLTNISNKDKVLDLYIDGEHQAAKPNEDSCRHFSDTGNDDCLAEKGALPCARKPPRVQSCAPCSLSYDKENLKSYLYREPNDIHHYRFTRDLRTDDVKLVSPRKHRRRHSEKLSHAFAEKSLKSREYDSETTTTIEDIHEDSSDLHPSLNSSDMLETHPSELTSPYASINGHATEEVLYIQKQSHIPENRSWDNKDDKVVDSGMQEEVADEELLRKAKEVEERLMLLYEENLEPENFRSKTLNLTSLLHMIQNISEDRRYLALELSSQIKCRLAERSFAREQFKQSKVELDTRTRRLEKEKNELQLSLEKELDRRSNDWSLKLGKFQSEEQRLRERVRELAEQNVSLQRELSSLKANEVEAGSRIINSEMQLNDLSANLEEMRTENHDLRESLSEIQSRFTGAEEDLDHLRRSYKEKDKENMELQKVVVRLQRTCSEQEKTISGLRQGFSDEIGKKSLEQRDDMSSLQMEQLRLTGVEQKLRKEVESCTLELESLRHENISLLDRLQVTGNGRGFLIRLDQELRARVDGLQMQGLSLLNDNSHLCCELLEFIKHKQYKHLQAADNGFDGDSMIEYSLKYQSLRRGIENFRRSLQAIMAILDEKSTLEEAEFRSQVNEGGRSGQSKGQASEDEMELKLQAEVMLTRVLREKLCSREHEIEQLQADLASSIRGNDVLQTELQRLRDELSCLTLKMKDMELQIVKKDEKSNHLQLALQDSMRELSSLRSILTKVSEERDSLWEEGRQLKKTKMLMHDEVLCLRKKIEVLDEDILLKEGQISILRDSLEKPFDIICSPKLKEEFTLE